MRLGDDQVRDHAAGLVRDARRSLDELERSLARAREEVSALEARAARGRDRVRLAQRMRLRLLDAVRARDAASDATDEA